MQFPLKELMEKLAVDRELTSYETQPWMFYDDEKGITCSAEVRMGPSSVDIEAEVQFLMDEDAPYDDEDDDDDEDGAPVGMALGPGEEIPEDVDTQEQRKKTVFPKLKPGGRQQLFYMRVLPSIDDWKPEQLRVKGKSYVNEIGGWEQKGCDVFVACVQAIQMDELPDIDELIDRELVDRDSRGGRRGKIGKKSPKVKPAALMGMGGKP